MQTLHTQLSHSTNWHISPAAAKKLVKDGAITGLTLDMSSESIFCVSCAKAKPTHKPVLKEKAGPCTTSFGEKVHLDGWGPTNPESYDKQTYFVSFTDNHTPWSSIKPMALKSGT
jgi:hypothetical protein